VSIDREKIISVDDQVYALGELEGVLRKKLESYGEAPTIRLNADRDLNMEEVFVFLDIARRNRYKVILGTRPSGS
jgi:biopolymer transport protein ExbD